MEGSSADPQSLNRYAYVENDPINMADPTGLCPPWGPYISGYALKHNPEGGPYHNRCNETAWGEGNPFSFAVNLLSASENDNENVYYAGATPNRLWVKNLQSRRRSRNLEATTAVMVGHFPKVRIPGEADYDSGMIPITHSCLIPISVHRAKAIIIK